MISPSREPKLTSARARKAVEFIYLLLDHPKKVSQLINPQSELPGDNYSEIELTSPSSQFVCQFSRLFCLKTSNTTGKDYLSRLTKLGNLNCQLLLSAAILYLRVLQKLGSLVYSLQNYAVKVFAACVSISHKFMNDDGLSHKALSAVLGLNASRMTVLEFFLLDEILGYKALVEREECFEACLWLAALPRALRNC